MRSIWLGCGEDLLWYVFGVSINYPLTPSVPPSECPDVKITNDGGLNPVWHGILYSCTHMATVGVKGLTKRTYEHRRRFEQVAERIVEQVEYRAGVQVGKANNLIRKECLSRSCVNTTVVEGLA